MDNTEIQVQTGPSARGNKQVRVLSDMFRIALLEHKGERIGNRERRKLINRLPAELGAHKLDDWLDDDSTATRYQASELLLTDAIESTSLLQEQVHRTVVAGAESVKVVRESGCAWYNVTSNSFRVPLGEAQINAPIVAEGAEIKDRTQDYDYRTFTIQKIAAKPRISFEMIEDGLVDAVAEEVFFAGASVENKMNLDAIEELIAHAGNITTYDATNRASGTAGVGLNHIKQAVGLIRADGFNPDTIIMCPDLENDLLYNINLAYVANSGSNSIIAQGRLPPYVYGMKSFVTGNGSTTAANWRYTTDGDVAGIVMEAKRALGVAMRRDLTVKKVDDIVHELNTVTVTMRVDSDRLHGNASAKVTYQSA